MYLPVVATLDQAGVDRSAKAECICGKEKNLSECHLVWWHRFDSEQYGWFAFCEADCITKRVTLGSC